MKVFNHGLLTPLSSNQNLEGGQFLNKTSEQIFKDTLSFADKPSRLLKGIKAIVSIPFVIVNGLWTLVKRTIYFLSCCILCKPEDNPQKLVEALQKIQKASNKDAAWKEFVREYPRAIQKFIKRYIENERYASIKDSQDPNAGKNWDENVLPGMREDLIRRWKKHDDQLINVAIMHLQDDINAK